MAAHLNHTIVLARDPEASATFLTDMFGLPAPAPAGRFLAVETANGVSLDYAQADEVPPQHYAFLVTEAEFDHVLARIRTLGLDHWADPGQHRPGEVNHNDGGRGVYFLDPSGHFLEALTRPYGSGS